MRLLGAAANPPPVNCRIKTISHRVPDAVWSVWPCNRLSEYTTAREYLAAMQEADVPLPVKDDKQTFFPFNTWSGYFTSRSKLKGISQQSHGPLNAAEGLFALRTPREAAARQRLWDLLETARRNAGVVQHHDAITGTPCSSQEGCAGVDQVMGAHNVLQVYEDMVTETKENSQQVIAAVRFHRTQIRFTNPIHKSDSQIRFTDPSTAPCQPNEGRYGELLSSSAHYRSNNDHMPAPQLKGCWGCARCVNRCSGSRSVLSSARVSSCSATL